MSQSDRCPRVLISNFGYELCNKMMGGSLIRGDDGDDANIVYGKKIGGSCCLDDGRRIAWERKMGWRGRQGKCGEPPHETTKSEEY